MLLYFQVFQLALGYLADQFPQQLPQIQDYRFRLYYHLLLVVLLFQLALGYLADRFLQQLHQILDFHPIQLALDYLLHHHRLRRQDFLQILLNPVVELLLTAQ